MLKAKQKLSAVDLKNEVIYCTVYASPTAHSIVDIFFEKIRSDRVFEWNVMHSKIMTQSCVDIDGVLCVDPTEEENDDGERYKNFLLNATSLRIPSVKIKCLVTCRLEKYRAQTETWLADHGVEYEKLIMMNLPSKQARQASGDHASFKADVYISTNAKLFIESNNSQANEIARIANKPVLCIESQKMVYPSIVPYATKRVLRDPFSIYRRIKLFINRFNRYLFDINPPNI
jgi:orotate phosphoribosyltransferase